jgi:GT2 family glycosyltransferase
VTSAACSVIVPVHNNAVLTKQCLNWLLEEQSNRLHEIIVVNDGSTDTTPQLLSDYADQVHVVTRTANEGFAASCNDGAAAASGHYLLFLNNDTFPQSGWLDALAEYADGRAEAAAVGAKLLFPNNLVQHAGVVITQERVPRHIYAGFPSHHSAVNKSRQFQVVTAACALMRRSAFEALGGFDEEFVNGYEDVDLCLRFRQHGHEVHYCHRSVLYHLESPTRGRTAYDHNVRLFQERWGPFVCPDDIDYYLADGLITFNYWEQYPMGIEVSPLLGAIEYQGKKPGVDEILLARARQVFDAMQENSRLRLGVGLPFLEDLKPSAPVERDELDRPKRPASRQPRVGTLRTATRISIIIPVKNAELRLRDLIPRILNQKIGSELEVVAVDSGSSDGTIDVLRDAGATVIPIEPHAFNHGLTRQLAAEQAGGDILVFLNSTAMPRDDRWLSNLLTPLKEQSRLAGVCSRVLPPPDADPLEQRDGFRDPSASPARSVRGIDDWDLYRSLSPHELRLFINFHTVSAAIPRHILDEVPFREVRAIGEDIQWAKDALEAGYQIQHEPTSVIYHHHKRRCDELFQLNVDDGLANHDIVGRTVSDAEVLPWILSMSQDDWQYLEETGSLGPADLARLQVIAVLRRTAQALGQWAGSNADRLPQELISHISRIERNRVGRSGQLTPL